MIVLDASAAVDFLLVLKPKADWVTEQILSQPGSSLHAPSVFDVEVCSAVSRHCRRRVVTPARADRALRNLTDMRLHRYHHKTLIRRMWLLRDNITAADAAYVALAQLLDATLVTTDARLARAARGEVRIETFDEA
jgi:predicted nucleic acid-binding protein